MASPPKRTPLFQSHVSEGGKMVDFHGFELPIWYSSIQEEHVSTRSSAGVFDVSHMGFFRFEGEGVRKWLSSISTQEYMKFPPGRCGYTHFLYYEGNIIDDMIFAINSETEVFGVPNATMVSSMKEWLSTLLPDDGSIQIYDLSDSTSIIALQGPRSDEVVIDILGIENSVGRFRCKEIGGNPLNISGWIQGTGYTGEKGVEIFIENKYSERLWREFCKDQRVSPVGLGARDTLRLEKGYLLSGQDFLWPQIGDAEEPLPSGYLARNSSETAVPYGLDMSHDFIGKQSMISLSNSGTRWWGMKCLERGPSPRSGHLVMQGDGDGAKVVGYVTSGGPSPSMGMTGIAMGYLSGCEEGQEVWIQTSARRRVRSVVTIPPFL